MRKEVRGVVLAAFCRLINQRLYKLALLRKAYRGVCWPAGSEAGKQTLDLFTCCLLVCVCLCIGSVYEMSPQGSLNFSLLAHVPKFINVHACVNNYSCAKASIKWLIVIIFILFVSAPRIFGKLENFKLRMQEIL